MKMNEWINQSNSKTTITVRTSFRFASEACATLAVKKKKVDSFIHSFRFPTTTTTTTGGNCAVPMRKRETFEDGSDSVRIPYIWLVLCPNPISYWMYVFLQQSTLPKCRRTTVVWYRYCTYEHYYLLFVVVSANTNKRPPPPPPSLSLSLSFAVFRALQHQSFLPCCNASVESNHFESNRIESNRIELWFVSFVAINQILPWLLL